MASVEEFQKDIAEIKARNKRVEADKAWEESWTRKIIIFLLTYIVIVVFFFVAELPEPFANAIVPAMAFVLSTLTVPVVKSYWVKHVRKK